MRIIRTLASPDGKSRILIKQGDDGNYRLAAERFYRSEYEGEIVGEGWGAMGALDLITDNLEEAESRARRELTFLERTFSD